MKIKYFTLIVFSALAAAIVGGCAANQTQSTEIPTSASPIIGHYKGTNPDTVFDITTSGIENFSITVPLETSQLCQLGGFGTIKINSDNSFTYTETDQANVSHPDIIINGKIEGSNVSGDYSYNTCGVTFSDKMLTGKWAAYFYSSNIEGIVPGKYSGSDLSVDPGYSVSFEVKGLDIYNFQISIFRNGSLCETENSDTFTWNKPLDLPGKIEINTLKEGTAYGSYSSSTCGITSWTANHK